AGAAAASGFAGWKWLTTRGDADGTPWPFRRTLELNEELSKKLYSASRLAPVYEKSQAGEPKPNATEGLTTDLDPASWNIKVNLDSTTYAEYSLATIRELPRTEIVTELKCIEGWSQVVHWTGARFSDFLAKCANSSSAEKRYVGMSTPDDGYYVGL